MHFKKRSLLFSMLILLLLGLAITVSADGFFVEPEVSVLFTYNGEQSGDGFGWVSENLGDLTGDGVNDFVITAPFYAPDGVTPTGKFYVYSGADGALLHAETGSGFALLGYSADAAGDVNADGVPDYLVSGPAPGGGAIVYSGADHTVLLSVSGQPGTSFGFDVAGAGDINGDGQADFIVGARRASFSYNQAGRVTLFSGADGAVLWSVDGFRESALLGSGVGLVGDVNGDGVPDQVAGAPGGGDKGRGEAYVLSGLDGSIIHTLKSVGLPGSPATFAVFHASGAGDVNNDGTPDIYIGDYNAQRGQHGGNGGQGKNLVPSGTGRVYVFSGADGSRLHVLDAEQNGDGFGPGRGIGDVNNDGYGDLITAAYTSSAGASFGGKAYIHSGQDGQVLRTMTGTVASVLLGVDALSVGDISGDGLADYVITGSGVVHVVAGTPLP